MVFKRGSVWQKSGIKPESVCCYFGVGSLLSSARHGTPETVGFPPLDVPHATWEKTPQEETEMSRTKELQALIDDLAIGDLPAIASLIDRRCDQAMKSFDVADENQRAFEVLDAFGPLEDCQERLEAIARDVAKICAILVDEIDGVPEKK